MQFTLFTSGLPQVATEVHFQIDLNGPVAYSPLLPNRTAAIIAIKKLIRWLRTEDARADQVVGRAEAGFYLQLPGASAPPIGPTRYLSTRAQAQQLGDQLRAAAQAIHFPLNILTPDRKATPAYFAAHYDSSLTPAESTLLSSLAPNDTKPLFFDFSWAEKQERYYYLFRTADKKPFIFSPGYRTSAQRTRGLAIFLQHAADRERWVMQWDNEQPYYELMTRTGGSLIRTAPFPDQMALLHYRRYFLEELPRWKEALAHNPETVDTSSIERPLEYRLDRAAINQQPGYECFSERMRGREYYYFLLSDALGNALLYSPAYPTAAIRDGALQSVFRQLPDTDYLSFDRDGGLHYFRLFAEDQQELSRSRTSECPDQLQQELTWLRSRAGAWALLQQGEDSWCLSASEEIRVLERMSGAPERPVILAGTSAAVPLSIELLLGQTANREPLPPPPVDEPLPSEKTSSVPVSTGAPAAGAVDLKRDTQLSASRRAVAAPNLQSPRSRVSRYLWFALLGLVLISGLLAFGLDFRGDVWADACATVRRADNCQAYLAYLARYGDQVPCAREFEQRLTELACSDRQAAPSDATVVAASAAPPDTTPLIATSRPASKPAPAVAGTGRQFDGVSFKRVGTLWVMAEDLAGGPYTWEIGRAACANRGWRLPCREEMPYLVDERYRGEQLIAKSGTTLANATTADAYVLLDPASPAAREVGYWTGNADDDYHAWSFRYIGSDGQSWRRHKSTRLPCRCVFSATPAARPCSAPSSVTIGNEAR